MDGKKTGTKEMEGRHRTLLGGTGTALSGKQTVLAHRAALTYVQHCPEEEAFEFFCVLPGSESRVSTSASG